MSERFYSQMLETAENKLTAAIESEPELRKQFHEKQRSILQEKIVNLYVQYCEVAHLLNEVHANICHPQKRSLVRETLDLLMARALELRHEIVLIAFMETPYFCDSALRLKILPGNIGLPIPYYLRRERLPEHERNCLMVKEVFDRVGRKPNQDDLYAMSIEEAVRIIQIQERARQGRVRSQLMVQIRRKNEKTQTKSLVVKQASEDVAAMRIQAVWRSFKVRKMVKNLRDDEMVFLGMKRAEDYNLTWAPKLDPIVSERDRLRMIEQELYKKAVDEVYKKAVDTEEKIIKEKLEKQLREYFEKYFEMTEKLPDIPKEEEGGSAAIDMNYFPTTEEDESKTRKSLVYGATSKPQKKKGKKKGKKSQQGKEKNVEEEQEENQKRLSKLQPSKNVDGVQKATSLYRGYWATPEVKQRSFEDPSFDLPLIEREKRQEVEKEVRRVVDVKMRKELDSLKTAWDKDLGRKRGRKTLRLRRGGRKSKKKREKDLTPDRTLESLVEELATYGILRPPREMRYQDLIGEISMVTPRKDAPPTLGDNLQAFLEMCLLPLGSSELRSRSPLLRSILLAGPPSTGKASMVHALCQEVGAVLFDLSPHNLAGKYPGKAGLAMLFHLVNKVSRLLQPAVIFIEDLEKIIKRPAKGERGFEPGKRMKKDLPKLIKSIAVEERILVIATTNQPWECDLKALFALFPRTITFFPPEYSTRHKVWHEKIRQILTEQEQTLGVEADLTSLARITDGYTVGSIIRAISETLSDRRLAKLSHVPIKASEFLPAIAKLEPVYKDDLEALTSWSQKTPLAKRSQKAAKAEEALLEPSQPAVKTKPKNKKNKPKKK